MPRVRLRIESLLALLTLLLLLLGGDCARQPETALQTELTVYFLDVGQGDAAILVSGEHAMIIDGGDASKSQLIYAYLRKTLGITQLDAVIGTHPHNDHIGGLAAALNACTASHVYCSVTSWDSRAFRSLEKYTLAQGQTITIPNEGACFPLGSAVVTFLSDGQGFEDVNDGSLIIRVDCGETSFLFTGDAAWEAERALLTNGARLDADVLKVAHHGSGSSSSSAFLHDVAPEYDVISVGRDNSYGHPTEETLMRLAETGAEILRTDEHGTICIHTDGTHLTVTTEK